MESRQVFRLQILVSRMLFTFTIKHPFAGFNRLQVAEAFFNSQIEEELRDLGEENFGFESDVHLDEVPKKIEERPCQQLYPHHCSEICASKGCRILFCIDAQWKQTFEHCAFVQQVWNSFSTEAHAISSYYF